jgi:hypothetical protein
MRETELLPISVLFFASRIIAGGDDALSVYFLLLQRVCMCRPHTRCCPDNQHDSQKTQEGAGGGNKRKREVQNTS